MKKFGFTGSLPVLLVLGGGSGSKTVNDALRRRLPELLKKFNILHLCGKDNLMENPPEGYVQREYESDMGSAYACADLVLSRAGSNTVFELLALKKPALLVPLERASRGDQLENALYFERKGLYAVLREDMLDTLPDALEAAYGNAALKRALSESEIKSGTPEILELIRDTLPDGASG